MKGLFMSVTKLALLLVCLMSFAMESKEAPKETPVEAKVMPIMSKDLPNLPGKEGLMLFVEYPPGVRIQSIATTQMRLCMCWKVRS
jgi:hypothetical protein